jgi:membrane protein DedA with SNARE-associated domain
MLQGVLDAIRSVPPALAYGIIALLVFGEAAVFLGFVLPGETAVLLGGFLASRGHLDIVTLIVLVVVSAIVGDTVGYEVGRLVGPRVLNLRVLAKRRQRLDDARDFLARRGGSAVFLGRWVAFFRAVMPALAGTSRMRYPKFLAFNAAGGIAWGATVVLLGYAAGASYRQVEKTFGPAAALVVLAVVIVAVVVWRVRRHRRDRRPKDAPGRRA